MRNKTPIRRYVGCVEKFEICIFYYDSLVVGNHAVVDTRK